MTYNYKQYFNLITEGAGQRTYHPFELPKINSGNDVIKLFEDIADSIHNPNPDANTSTAPAVKIDGTNCSVRLQPKLENPQELEFVMDRGAGETRHPSGDYVPSMDMKGIRIADLGGKGRTSNKPWEVPGAGVPARFPDPAPADLLDLHGMWEAGKDVLTIFNGAFPAVQEEISKLGLDKFPTDPKSKTEENPKGDPAPFLGYFIGVEHVGPEEGETANVVDYSKSIEESKFLSLFGVMKYDWTEQVDGDGNATGKLLHGRSVSKVESDFMPILNDMADKMRPLAKKYGYGIKTRYPIALKPEVNVDYTQAYSEQITVLYEEGHDETRTLESWLKEAGNPHGKNFVLLSDIQTTMPWGAVEAKKAGAVQGCTAKVPYLVVLDAQQPLASWAKKEEWKNIIDGAMHYHACRQLGNVLLNLTTSEIGDLHTHEGIVFYDPKITGTPSMWLKISGEFIVEGMGGRIAKKMAAKQALKQQPQEPASVGAPGGEISKQYPNPNIKPMEKGQTMYGKPPEDMMSNTERLDKKYGKPDR
jgi:hypothetical protein